MERGKQHFSQLLRFFFDQNYTIGEAHKTLLATYPKCDFSYQDCFNVFRRYRYKRKSLTQRGMYTKELVEDEEVLELVDNSPDLTQPEMAILLGVAQRTLSGKFNILGVTRKKNKWTNELPKVALQIRYHNCVSLLSRHKKQKHFLNHVVFGSEMVLYYGIPDEKKSKAFNRPICENKVVVCIWWNYEGIVYYKVQQEHELNKSRYIHQLHKVREEIEKKQPHVANKKHKVLILNDSFAKLRIAKCVTETILNFGWEVLPSSINSLDSAACRKLLQTMRNDIEGITNIPFVSYEGIETCVDSWMKSSVNRFKSFNEFTVVPGTWERVVANGGKRLNEIYGESPQMFLS